LNDFDGNNYFDPIVTYFVEGKEYPAATRDDLMKQIPSLRAKFTKYSDYAKATIYDIFDESLLKKSLVKEATIAESVYLENQGNSKGFIVKSLPKLAQMSTIKSIWVEDLDKDGNLDAILVGNSYAPEVGTGRFDASLGVFLKGSGNGNFTAISNQKTGINLSGDTRQIIKIQTKKPFYLISKNNGAFQRLDF
jgi:enediyne biosynthesis protein E4